MKFSRDPNYEAAFVRTANHDDVSPEELEVEARRRKGRIRLAIGSAALVAVAATYGAVTILRSDSPEKQVARGIAYSAANSHISAMLEYKRSLQEKPDQPAVRILLGKELSLIGDPRAAEIEFQKAVDAKFDLDKSVPLLAESLLHQGSFDRVIEVVNGATIESPEANAALLAMRGSAYFALGREAEAEQSWAAAKDFVPGHAPTLIAQSRALAAKGKYAEAGAVLDGITSEASQIELLTLRGELARATGKPLEALTAYQAALKIEPANMLVRSNLAQTLLELDRYDEAQVEVNKILKPTPRYAQAQYLASLIWIGKKNFVAANEAAIKAVQLVPTDGRYQLLAGTLALQAGRRAEAEGYLNDAVTLMPQNATARRLLAMIYVDRNEAKRADQLFRPVFDTFGSDQDVARLAARIALQQGNAVKAANAFNGVDASDPKNVDATLLAASLKLRSGDKAGGFKRLQAASLANPDNPDVDVALVIAHLTFNEVNEAMAQWKTLSRKEPDSARTLNLLAAIDFARGDKVAARRAMEQSAQADPHYLPPVSGLAMLDVGEKKNDDALKRLKQFAASNPQNVEATMLLIRIEQANGASREALIAELQAARKMNPKEPQLAVALAALFNEQGDAKQAVAIAEEGLTASPANIALLQFVADQALRSGDAARALAAFNKLQQLDAGSADYPTGAGLALIKLGKYEEALSAFRLGLAHNADSLDRQFAMVGSFIAAGRGDEAQRILYEISRAAPKSPLLTELDADVKLQLKQYPEAIATYRKALAQNPGSRVAIKTASALLTARQRGEANTFLTDWLKAHPTDDQVRLFDADIASRSKDYVRASDDFRALATAHPNDPSVLNNLAWNLAQIKDPTAISYAEKASGLAPDNAAITDTLGWLLVEKGDTDRGLGLIEKASRNAPDQLDIHLHLAKAQLKQGQKAAARTTLQGLIAKAPDSEQAKASQALLATF
jgi:putative PEP-CTERM system TPR-repeat lipoprotein